MEKHSDDAAFIVDLDRLPTQFPTHKNDSLFWEALGRVIGTFGFLEATLGKAIFAVVGTTFVEGSLDKKQIASLEKIFGSAISDPLAGKIQSYKRALEGNSRIEFSEYEHLIDELVDITKIRNAVCHGHWAPPDESGKSELIFYDRKYENPGVRADAVWLDKLRFRILDLVISVINSVTQMGYQFPGSQGPGKLCWSKAPDKS